MTADVISPRNQRRLFLHGWKYHTKQTVEFTGAPCGWGVVVQISVLDIHANLCIFYQSLAYLTIIILVSVINKGRFLLIFILFLFFLPWQHASPIGGQGMDQMAVLFGPVTNFWLMKEKIQ